MARKKVIKSESALVSWEQVDEALLNIGLLEREIEQRENELNEYLEELKKQTVAEVQPLLAQKTYLENQIKDFCLARRTEMDGKSRKLNFGTVGFRRSSRVVVAQVEECLARLQELGLWDCIRMKKSVDKARLKGLDELTIEKVGARLVVEEVFAYQLDHQKVESYTDMTNAKELM